MLKSMTEYYMNVLTVPIKIWTYAIWNHTDYATVTLKSMSANCVINHFVSVHNDADTSRTKNVLNYPDLQNNDFLKKAVGTQKSWQN